MSWREAQLSLQVAAEERVGSLRRQELLKARAAEDAAAQAVAQALSGAPPGR